VDERLGRVGASMTTELFVVPVLHLPENNHNAPGYVWHRFHPGLADLEGVRWAWVTYLLEDVGVLIADVTVEQRELLDTQAGVVAVPDLDRTVETVPQQDRVRGLLEAVDVPGGWVNIGMTYRTIVRILLWIFTYHNRVVALIQRPVFAGDLDLEMTMAEIPAWIRDAMAQAAGEMGYDYGWVEPSTTLRELLYGMGVQFSAVPYEIRGAGLSLVV